MNAEGVKLTTYFGERQRIGERFLADRVMDVYAEHELQTQSRDARRSRASAPSTHLAPTAC